MTDEVLITGTAGGVIPVTRIDGEALRDAKPGPVASRRREIGSWNIPILLWMLLVCTVLAAPFLPEAAAQDSDDAVLLAALRGGGYNLYFRHVATDWSLSDRVDVVDDWLSCDPARMRQLSDAGRADARGIGDAMRKLKIPVGEVLASPYCRTMETARLMRVGPVRASTDVMNLRAARFFGGRGAIVTSAQRLLATPPPTRSNRVIVAHGNVAREATPAYPGEGEGLVLKPSADGGFSLVGRVTPAEWAELARRYADPAQ